MSLVKSINFEFGFHGLICKHDRWGYLCGYVGVPCEHPLYEKRFDQCLQGCPPEPLSWRKIYADANAIPGFPRLEVPEGNPAADREWDHWPCGWGAERHPTPDNQLQAHGGVDYSGREIEGMRPDLYYFGFQCGHAWDTWPGDPNPYPDAVYRDEAYVEAQVRSLYDQLRSYVLVRSVADDLAKPQGGGSNG